MKWNFRIKAHNLIIDGNNIKIFMGLHQACEIFTNFISLIAKKKVNFGIKVNYAVLNSIKRFVITLIYTLLSNYNKFYGF